MKRIFKIGIFLFYIYGIFQIWKAVGYINHPYFVFQAILISVYGVLIIGKFSSIF